MPGFHLLAGGRDMAREMMVLVGASRKLIPVLSGITVALFGRHALAQTASPQAAPFWMQMFPIIVVFVIMYFLMIRPQAKRQKMHQDFISKLKRGDQVVTASGFLGRIEGMTDQFVTLEIADGVRVKVLRSQIATSAGSATDAVGAKA